jgi:hypothetical protein
MLRIQARMTAGIQYWRNRNVSPWQRSLQNIRRELRSDTGQVVFALSILKGKVMRQN